MKYSKRTGDISHIATVLSELAPSIDEEKLILLAEELGETSQMQRIELIIT